MKNFESNFVLLAATLFVMPVMAGCDHDPQSFHVIMLRDGERFPTSNLAEEIIEHQPDALVMHSDAVSEDIEEACTQHGVELITWDDNGWDPNPFYCGPIQCGSMTKFCCGAPKQEYCCRPPPVSNPED